MITKTGDYGWTGSSDGERIAKNTDKIRAIGSIDELNSFIGLALTKISPMTMGISMLREVQHRLFDIGAELSNAKSIITEENLVDLMDCCERVNETLYPLKNFIIPGGTQAAARLHVARTVCRRAELDLWKLADSTNYSGNQMDPHCYGCLNPMSVRYINRLSDFLFIMARQENRERPVLWEQRSPEE